VGIVTYVQAYLFNKQPYGPNPNGELPPLFKSHYDSISNGVRDITALDIALNMQWYSFFDTAIEGKGWLTAYAPQNDSDKADTAIADVSEIAAGLNLEVPEYSEELMDAI
ncbi:hypothetical protein MP638_005286, partial [Amoeboaphelidium occidentale]